MHTLEVAYTVAKTQVENSTSQKPFKDTVRNYLSSFMPYTKTSNLPAPNLPHNRNTTVRENSFIPNGVLRAHVIKAECCLLSSILQLTQENTLGYLKCGLNLRRGNLIVIQNYYLLPPKKKPQQNGSLIYFQLQPTTVTVLCGKSTKKWDKSTQIIWIVILSLPFSSGLVQFISFFPLYLQSFSVSFLLWDGKVTNSWVLLY